MTPGKYKLTVTSQETTTHTSASETVNFELTKAKATITWKPPASLSWKPRFALDTDLPKATVDSGGGLTCVADPPTTPMTPGKYKLTVTSQETTTHTSASETVNFELTKVQATIKFKKPDAVDAVVGGFLLSKDQLNATVEPPACPLAYVSATGEVLEIGTRLKADTHKLTLKVADVVHYEPQEIPFELEVKKVKPVIVWNDPDPQDYVDGGFALAKDQLNAAITPGAGKPDYNPSEGKKLDPGEHDLNVTALATDFFEAVTTADPVKFLVRKAKIEIIVPPPVVEDYVPPSGFTLDTTKLNAKTDPLNVELKYTLAGQLLNGVKLLNAGEYTIKVEVKDDKKYEAAPVYVKFTVNKIAPVITWREPAGVSGTVPSPGKRAEFRLTTTELAATCVPGEQSTLVYTPGVGDMVKEGANVLTVTHPESTNYKYLTQSVRLYVGGSADAIAGYAGVRGGGTSTFKPGRGTQLNSQVEARWNDTANNTLQADAQDLMTAMQNMGGKELLEYMNNKVPNSSDRKIPAQTSSNPYPNYIWKLPNGLQVRYKPNGDVHVNKTGSTPVPMFCIEVLDPSCTTLFSASPNDIAAKVSVDGELAPVGPKETNVPRSYTGAAKTDYAGGGCGATHLMCRQDKLDQKIFCGTSGDILPGQPLTLELLGVKLPPDHGIPTLNPTVLNVGDNQDVTIDVAETPRFKVATQVKIKVNVKKCKPTITWERPKDITYGKTLADAELKTKVEPTWAGTTTNTPDTDTVKPPGRYVVIATLAGTDKSEEVTEKVEVTVLKATPTITWNPPADAEDTGAGVVLENVKQLNAKVEPAHLEAKLVYSPPAGTRLGEGTHKLQVRTDGDANYKGAVKEVDFKIEKKAAKV
jgi:hypothetical protein